MITVTVFSISVFSLISLSVCIITESSYPTVRPVKYSYLQPGGTEEINNVAFMKESSSFSVPSSIDFIQFDCSHWMPIIWNFNNYPTVVSGGTKLAIRIRNQRTGNGSIGFMYRSLLTISFKHWLDMASKQILITRLALACQSRENENLITYVQIERGGNSQLHTKKLSIYSSGPTQIERITITGTSHKLCFLEMFYEARKRLIECRTSSSKAAVPLNMLSIHNNDEMEAVIGKNNKNCSWVPKPCYTSENAHCDSPHVRVVNESSMALCNFQNGIIQKTPIYISSVRKNLPVMYLNYDLFLEKSQPQIRTQDTVFEVLQSYTFSCVGESMAFSESFYWQRNMYSRILERGDDEGTVGNQIWSNLTIRFDQLGKQKVTCLVPIWQSEDWRNVSVLVDVVPSLKPLILDFNYNQSSSGQDNNNGTSNETNNINWIFSCVSIGIRPMNVSWFIDKINVHEEFLKTEGRNNSNSVRIQVIEDDKDQRTTSFLSIPQQVLVKTRSTVQCMVQNALGADEKFREIDVVLNETDVMDFEKQAKNTTEEIVLDNDENAYYLTVIGVACVLVVVVLVCSGLLYFAYLKIRRQNAELAFLSDAEILDFEQGQAKGDSAFLLPYNVEYEVNMDNLTIGTTILGEGFFGQVRKGRYEGVRVAIKSVKASALGSHFKVFLSELKVMCFVGRHPHIINLVGACTKNLRKRELFLIYEYCGNGNMLQFMRNSRKLFVDLFSRGSTSKSTQVEDEPSTPSDNPQTRQSSRWSSKMRNFKSQSQKNKVLTTADLVRWAFEISSAMEFLANKNICHGDLAARNVLITDQLIAKIGDFGLAKDLLDYSIYIQKKKCPLPLKWMAIESLQDLEFSIQSDVWSFGITVWEIFSLGEVPYPGMDWGFESWKLLRDGHRMDSPKYASTYIFTIISACWQLTPKDRPSFAQLELWFAEELKRLRN